MQSSAAAIRAAEAGFSDTSLDPPQRDAIASNLIVLARSLLDNKPIVIGCARLIRYQQYSYGASYAKHECELHFDKERQLQLHDCLMLLTWNPSAEAVDFALDVITDIRTNNAALHDAIALLDAVAGEHPHVAAHAEKAKRQRVARQHFHEDNAEALANLSRNLELCFTGRDRDLDLIFEVLPDQNTARVHTPVPRSRVERCVVKFALSEDFYLRESSREGVVFRVHVTYRSNI